MGRGAARRPLVYGQSLLLGLVIAFARRGLSGVSTSAKDKAADRELPAPEIDAGASFLRRHAPRLTEGRLLALEAEDHYLRVHTDRGSTLILMRLRDAAEALGPSAGWQPHRSFWLASGVEANAQRHGQSVLAPRPPDRPRRPGQSAERRRDEGRGLPAGERVGRCPRGLS